MYDRGGQSHGNVEHARKISLDSDMRVWDVLAERPTDRQTDALTAILRVHTA